MLNISSEFKKVLEHYPELIDLIEQNKIKEFYDILYGDNPKYVHGNSYLLRPKNIMDAYKILTALDINPLQYLSVLPEMIISDIKVDKLIIPANIDTIKEFGIYYCDIKQLVIINELITIDTAGIWQCNINEFICNADNITLTGLGTFVSFLMYIKQKQSNNTKFVFKENCKIFENDYGWSDIKKLIKDGELKREFNIELM